jgi:hypothetical protein
MELQVDDSVSEKNTSSFFRADDGGSMFLSPHARRNNPEDQSTLLHSRANFRFPTGKITILLPTTRYLIGHKSETVHATSILTPA